MHNDTAAVLDAALDAMLIEWHEVASSERVGEGYPSVNTTCRMYRVSRQYDFENGAIDDDHRKVRGEAIGHCVDRLADPWRTALHLNARNLATGVYVWSSPRLPADREARAVVVMEARNKLLRELQADGLL